MERQSDEIDLEETETDEIYQVENTTTFHSINIQ